MPTPRIKISPAALRVLRYCERRYSDGRVRPCLFGNYKTIRNLHDSGIIEPWIGFGAPMFRLTEKGKEMLKDA